MCHGNLGCSISSFSAWPKFSSREPQDPKRAIPQWPPQLWIEIALFSKHPLTTDQIYEAKKCMYKSSCLTAPRFGHSKTLGVIAFVVLKNCKIISSSGNLIWFPSLLPIPATQNPASLDTCQLNSITTTTTNSLLVWQRLTYLKEKLAMTSEISDIPDQTFLSLLRGTQKLMRKLRCVQ